MKVTNNSRVCIKHFHEKDVTTKEVFPAHDGQPEVTVSTIEWDGRIGFIATFSD